MVNIQNIKNNLNDVVTLLSPDELAEIYFKDRKRYMKFGMEGQQKKALEVLKRNDEFYKKHYRKNPNLFHKTHHKYLEWNHDYTHFQHFQELIATADREKSIFEFDLQVMEALEYFLDISQQTGFENSINNALKLVKTVKSRLIKDIEVYKTVIPEIENMVEDNEYFNEHNYFEDVDPIGYKNLHWKDWLTTRMNIGSNNGPVKQTKGK